ncbi:isoleucine--tRNA ligase [Cephaloticoccus primus]|uniref:Isoleucine--tRNA ligase n=1 Tax=Cephaloticoccus primus TaxID=1548207 RepID=A0A139SN64_9BACT|nr:isoleucine--tRNA ligase [Cephaloticoccus primus]KXU35930.1 isoleucine--tRNA ligase [Cephaloticoccus primus]
MAQDLKDTLLLPKTDFPMRANLVQREPARLKHWEQLDLFAAMQRKRAHSDKSFVLHDGPPFTNGDVHIGTALNKSLKDFVNRFKSMSGYRTPYVPGWDCHGLPIEQKVSAEIRAQNLELTTAELRARCDAFSEQWIATQRAQFKRIGVLADWDNEYKTKSPAFEADILRTFAAFVEQGLVYRSKKPVYWSIPFETALAEAEIEYKPHTSVAIWVKFPIPAAEAQRVGLPTDKPLSVVIWTTTPWTIPANLAIALHPQVEYAVADTGAERLIVAQALLGAVAAAAKLEPAPAIVATLEGAKLEGLRARHPFIDRASPIVLADYVTTESGTGAVHTAPGHGAEDYQTGLKYGLDIYCPVGDDGRYLDDGQIPAELVGLSTLETAEDAKARKPSAANLAVLKKLAESGALLAKAKYEHSYPHCWRSKTPIIFRAVDQWFVSLDATDAAAQTVNHAATEEASVEEKNAGRAANAQYAPIKGTAPTPRKIALAEIGKIAAAGGWIPAWGEARIRGAVESRPDWCISRQRAWGVPLVAFYGPDKQPYLDADVVRAVADRVARHGSNCWYALSAAELLDGVALPAHWPPASELRCGRDTLDVWIDSGSTQAAVLRRGQGGTHWPADLYLEGSDQHRGWFQSSLWNSVIASGAAPYKAVLTHGFIVDKDRQKISKSSSYQKPQTAEAYIGQYGADVIRLWIASQDFRDDIPVDDEILKNVGEAYRLFRNTFRFQLSNLFDFRLGQDAVPLGEMDALDRWALHQCAALIDECTRAYSRYEFHRVYQLCNQFCAVTLSAIYHDILKDRLYTLGAAHPLRRSSQTAIYHLFHSLVRLLAPILSFTTDEAWSYATAGCEYTSDSVHLQDWPSAPAEWRDEKLADEFERLLRVRAQVSQQIEPRRAAGELGKSLDAVITITGRAADEVFAMLQRYREALPELFIVSQVALETAAGDSSTAEAEAGSPSGDGLRILVRTGEEAGLVRCPRCWRWEPALDPASGVCPRCTEALSTAHAA